MKVIIAIIPSGLIGVLFEDKIDELFFNPTTVAIALISQRNLDDAVGGERSNF